MKLFISIMALLLFSVSCKSPPTKTDYRAGGTQQGFIPPPTLNSSMQNLKKSLTVLEPYFFDKAKFNDEKNHKFLAKEIHRLAEESKNVKHDPTLVSEDPTARFVASQFAEDLKRADENFSSGWKEFSRSQLMKVTSFCVECHTRLRQGTEFPTREVAAPYIKTIPVKDQIELMISFREFDAAFNLVLATLKRTDVQDISFGIDHVARLGLLVVVQNKQDMQKAQQLVDAIEKNSTLPKYLKDDNKRWQVSLNKWSSNDDLRTLDKVREFLKQSDKSEVEYMRAIAALLRILTGELNQEELGEALLLTGESYESLNKISYMTLHDNYYESCVRKTAKTKWGKMCYEKLENSVKLSYTGSRGTRIPPDIKKSLHDLKNTLD